MNFAEKMKQAQGPNKLADDVFEDALLKELRTSGMEIINMVSVYMDSYCEGLIDAGVPKRIADTYLNAISDAVTTIVVELIRRRDEHDE